MNKFRLKYKREDSVKYISHLDLLRTLNRAVKRAGIPIAYSQGFNPHPILSFGLPLAVGVTSESEYLDMELEEQMEGEEILKRLNDMLPTGIRIIKALQLEPNTQKVSSMIGMAEYKVTVELKNDFSEPLTQYINDLLNRDIILIEKQGKKGLKQVDIRQGIHCLSLMEQDEKNITLYMRLNAGSTSNIKPEFVLKALEKYIERFEVDFAYIHRLKLLQANGMEI